MHVTHENPIRNGYITNREDAERQHLYWDHCRRETIPFIRVSKRGDYSKMLIDMLTSDYDFTPLGCETLLARLISIARLSFSADEMPFFAFGKDRVEISRVPTCYIGILSREFLRWFITNKRDSSLFVPFTDSNTLWDQIDIQNLFKRAESRAALVIRY